MDRTLNRSLFISVCAAIVMVAAGAVSGRNVTVEESSQSSLSFVATFSPDLHDLIVPADGMEPPYRSFLVGVPLGATVKLDRVQVLQTAPTEARNRLSQTAAAPGPAVISAPFEVRGHRLVTVRVFPVSGETIATKMVVGLSFEGAMSGRGAVTPDPEFDRIFKASVVNYEQFRTWPTAARTHTTAGTSANDPFALTQDWVKVFVIRTGLHRITGAELQGAGLDITGLPSDRIRLFNAGGKPLEVEATMPRAEFKEVPLIVEDGGDGRFDSNDKLYFYGEAVNRWTYSVGNQPRYLSNKYTTENVYWLTTSTAVPGSGLRMASVNAAPTGVFDTVVTSFYQRVRLEQDNILSIETNGHIEDYYEWFWTDSTQFSLFLDTPGAMSGESTFVFLNVKTSGNSSTQTGFVDLLVNGVAAESKNCTRTACSYVTQALTPTLNRFDLTLTPSRPSSPYIPPYLNYVELSYRRQTVPVNNRLDITLDGFTGRADMLVSDQFNANPWIFDLAEPMMPVQLTGYTRAGGQVEFAADLSTSKVNRYYVQDPGTASAPARLEHVTIPDLRADVTQADMIIVTVPQFTQDIAQYMQQRRSEGHSMRVVTVQDIMDNFAYGLFDPTAIRDYLMFAFENFTPPAPAKALLVGDGTYDFLNHTGVNAPNFVPPYVHPLDKTYSDENYVYFGDYGILDSDTSYVTSGRGYDMLIARWPVRDSRDIATILSKTFAYEKANNLGAWRSRVTIVADDEFADQRTNEIFHTQQAETLEKSHIPRYFTRDKIYLWEYPFVNRRKPEVNDAIVEAFDRGALVIDYIGHGNPDVWAHEHVLERSDDLPRMQNIDRLPLVFAASCQINFFDDPQRPGMGEDFVTMANGGAVAVVAAMRLVYSGPNADFNQQAFDILLYNDSLSIAEAVFAAKLLRQYQNPFFPVPQRNDRAYEFFGDPYLHLGLPHYRMEFTEFPDTLVALRRTRVAGRVVDTGGNTIARDGLLTVNVFDSDFDKVHNVLNASGDIIGSLAYSTSGPRISRGSVTITGGEFSFEFIPPLDISFGDKDGRIALYAKLDSVDAVGLVDSIVIGNQVAAIGDSIGPSIQYRLAGRNSFPGDGRVSRSDRLEIILSDSSGINLAGGIGHGITLEIDGDARNTINLTQAFVYNQDDFTTGQVPVDLADLPEGEHTVKIKAWDNANNSSSLEFTMTITSNVPLAINEMLPYPNPMYDYTTFYFELTQPVQRFSLDIFTLAGRKIRSFSGGNLPADLYPNSTLDLSWDGRDAVGDRVASGVYLFKATAMPQAGGAAVESFGKVVVVNQ